MVDLIDAVEADAHDRTVASPESSDSARTEPPSRAAATRLEATRVACSTHRCSSSRSPSASACGCCAPSCAPCRSRTTRRRTRRSCGSPSSGCGRATVPFDAWYPYLGLGSPQFLQYQALSHIVTAVLSIVFGDSMFRWTNYLLICTWPISVYIGARLLGSRPLAGRRRRARSRRCSSNVVGYGFEWASFVWLGSGMWSMLWALWLMPIAMGLAWRAVAKGERYALDGVRGRPHVRVPLHHRLSRAARARRVRARAPARRSLKRLGRSALVGLGGLLIFAFIFVPTLGGLKYVNVNSFQTGTFWENSYGPVQGLHVAVRRADLRLRAPSGRDRARRDRRRSCACGGRAATRPPASLLGLMVAEPAAVLGPPRRRPGARPPARRLRPAPAPLHHRGALRGHAARRHRFGVGVPHRRERRAVRAPDSRRRTLIAGAIACALAVVAMWPVLVDRDHYADNDRSYITGQVVRRPDATAPRSTRSSTSPSSAAAAASTRACRATGAVPPRSARSTLLYSCRCSSDADSLGFTLRTDSLSQDIESYFNEHEPGAVRPVQREVRAGSARTPTDGAGDPDRRRRAVTRSGRSRTSAATSRWSTRPSRCSRTAPTWPRS